MAFVTRAMTSPPTLAGKSGPLRTNGSGDLPVFADTLAAHPGTKEPDERGTNSGLVLRQESERALVGWG